ncbi:MATE family efflux transporter [Mesobaculum littorinae]|uniref:Multidrug-efflux transporter n=1 Tax=Mesobaculum littorinae TaxID=2486419 RepID=A0A438AIF0_9RHOB|nr:MATE family efflux transporter [Mesobaculum littorinae]RVV98479.1 MATE family efflux transporter [Mesobaculum littorinae]
MTSAPQDPRPEPSATGPAAPAGDLPFRGHLRAAFLLGLPLAGSHVAQLSLNLVDALMLGWYDVEALAAEVLGGTVYMVLLIMGSGFAWALMPMIAAAEAEGDTTQVRRVTRMGLWLSIAFALLTVPIVLSGHAIFAALGQPAQVAALAGDYLSIHGLGILPALGVMVLKSYLSALERARVVLVVTLMALPLNALLNHMLIFGHWGAPELGVRGAAIASLAVTVASLALLVAYSLRALPEHALFARFWRPDPEALGRVFRLGWPIGLTSLAEVGLFAASSVMMGWIGAIPLAAHGIALQITSLTFMVHVGMSNAATIRAGNAYARRDRTSLRQGALAAMALSGLGVLATVVVFLTAGAPLVGLFVDPGDPAREAVIAAGRVFLAAAALFQLADAGQVLALGVLRGVQDTRVPMVIAAFSYWALGVPASYLLAFHTPIGGVGIWIGMALGLACAGSLLMLRFWRGVARRP